MGLKRVGLGAVAFLACQGLLALAWGRWFRPATLEIPWFLGSKASIVGIQVALGLLAAIVAGRAPGWRKRLADFGGLTTGVMAAVAALFFAIGPEKLMVGPPRLWPVALASALLLLAPAILAGTLLGGYLGDLKK